MNRALAALFAGMFIVFTSIATCQTAGAFENKTAAGNENVILAFGDSLTAGYGVGPGEAFPDQLEAALQARGHQVKVVNAGVSGDTSSGGRARLDWVVSSLEQKPALVIVELGANDALRGLEPAITRENIDAIVKYLTDKNIPVLVAGMMAPPNLGQDYASEFNPIFADIAKQYDTGFYPFFLEGVAAQPDLNQDDGMHPTKEGVAVIVENILPYIETYLGAESAATNAD